MSTTVPPGWTMVSHSSTGPVSVDLVLRAAGERVVELVVDVHLDPTARTGLQQALQPVLDAAFGAFGDSGH